jgi:PST family polysaccharide transporter
VSLKSKSVEGVFWSGGGRLVQQLLGIGLTAAFARLLVPGDFGLVTMAMVFHGFIGLFRTMGLGTAVIQRKELTESHLTTVFLLNLVTGTALTGVVFLSAPFIAWFYEEPQLLNVVRLSSFGLLFTCVTVVHEALLLRRIEFHRVVKAEFYAFLVASTIAIIAAVNGLGVYALVLNGLSAVFFSSLFVFILNPWIPKARPNWRATGGLFRFGMNVMGMNLLNFIHRHADDLLIGKFLGKNLLGQYSMAYRTMRLPTQKISGTVSQVAFPVFSSIQEDVGRIRRGFVKMSRYLAVLLFPALIGLIITAPEAVPLAYGDKWRPAVFVIQVLTLAGILQALQSPMSTLFLSRGRPNLLFRYQILSTACYVGAFLLGVRWGIRGVAICYTAVTVLLSPLLYRLAFKLIRLRFEEYLDALKTPLLGGLIMGGVVMLLQLQCFRWGLPRLVVLINAVMLGVFVYPAALWFLDRKLFQEGADLLRLLTRRETKTSTETSETGKKQSAT